MYICICLGGHSIITSPSLPRLHLLNFGKPPPPANVQNFTLTPPPPTTTITTHPLPKQ